MQDNYCRTLYFKAWIEDNIFHSVYTVDVLTLEIAKQAVASRLRLFNGEEYPVFTDIRSIKSADAEARKYLSTHEATRLAAAGALIVGNQFHKVVGNIFLMVNKPAVPAKMFVNETEALNWLQQFKKIRSSA